jgi:hypothetical protein
MELTLHKLKEGFVVTSDEQPLRDYKGLMLNRVSLSLTNDMGVSLMEWFLKVIAQQDQLDFSTLSKEEQREIGWFDIEKFSKEASKKKVKLIYGERINNGDIDEYVKTGGLVIVTIGESLYKEGFQKAQELQSDRMFTLKDISKAMKYASEITNNKMKYMENYIESLSQPKSWKIEVEMERTRYPKGDDGWKDVYEPKFTGGKLKILKLL